jgi:UDP-glucose 4-epimerase
VRLLITGGAGFIGSHLAAQLLGDGHDVCVLDNLSTGRRSNLDHLPEVKLMEGDVRSSEAVTAAVAGCEAVYHLAALPSVPRSVADPLSSNATNVTGLLNVLLAARDAGVKRMLYASSSSVYGANPGLPKHESMATMPISPYAVAKLAGEGYCASLGPIYGLETVTVRYFNVFGPRQDPASQYAAVIPTFITALLAERAPVVHGDGAQSRDFTYVQNVVDATVRAMQVGRNGAVYNVACGQSTTLNELLTQLRQLLDSDLEAVHAPARAGDVRHSLADIEAARRDLGYEPGVQLREGLALTVDALREELRAAGEPVGVI